MKPKIVQDGETIIDARGHRCPTPTLKLRRAVARASSGERLRLLADDPMARIDIPHFAEGASVELLEMVETDGVIVARLRKTGSG